MSKKQSVIAFGAHPDDLEIGMGGALAKLARLGYDVNLVIATLPNFVKTDIKEQRRIEATMSAKTLGCKSPQFLDLSPDEITIGRKFVTMIDEIINKHKPEAVFTQWIGDSHQDHQALTRAVIAASRDSNNLFMYETTIPGGLTENAFRPQLYIDITETLEVKSNALDCFHSQKNNRCGNLWIDAVVGRCSYRGYQMNVKYAEAFEVVKVTKW
ncbi:MAG: Glucosamine-6-phosphate deaminase-like protein [Nitrososphaeraceae archaeon]|jgi:LmbE family N-acetylglucosaminyl deacetylase|nr:Glucosamine-6-phosphate deaminase-like protein [Nitrososphaeraceae archaeon]